MFINERPGRIGPGKSNKISFDNDDPTANWFKELFAMTGLDRREIFMTNACLYYPQDAAYAELTTSRSMTGFPRLAGGRTLPWRGRAACKFA
jgi:hypothetical protein